MKLTLSRIGPHSGAPPALRLFRGKARVVACNVADRALVKRRDEPIADHDRLASATLVLHCCAWPFRSCRIEAGKVAGDVVDRSIVKRCKQVVADQNGVTIRGWSLSAGGRRRLSGGET